MKWRRVLEAGGSGINGKTLLTTLIKILKERVMKAKNLFGAILGMSVLISAAFGTAAEAATVAYEDVGFIRGVGDQSESFTVASAGSYRVTLTDFTMPSNFDQLTLSVTTRRNEIDSISGSGWFDFSAEVGTTYFANLYGVAGGALDLGLYGISVESVAATVAPVPVPASLFMMVSALAAMGAFGRGGSRAVTSDTLPNEGLPA